jgi:hypothetical protein
MTPEPGYVIALAHAARGRRVFPWKPVTKPGKLKPTKQPLTEHGHLDATTDEARIIEWEKRWPGYLAGWALPEGIGLVDVDDPAAMDAAGLDLPPAPEQRGTLNRPDGLHRLYVVPDGRHWGPWDVPMLRLIACLFDTVERGAASASLQTELRMLLDGYGLTPKGRQDRHWLPPEEPEAPARPASGRYAHLRAVAAPGAANIEPEGA